MVEEEQLKAATRKRSLDRKSEGPLHLIGVAKVPARRSNAHRATASAPSTWVPEREDTDGGGHEGEARSSGNTGPIEQAAGSDATLLRNVRRLPSSFSRGSSRGQPVLEPLRASKVCSTRLGVDDLAFMGLLLQCATSVAEFCRVCGMRAPQHCDIIYAFSQGEVDSLCSKLLSARVSPLGLDIEWHVTFKSGKGLILDLRSDHAFQTLSERARHTGGLGLLQGRRHARPV
jgi:hypothetical protein